MCVTLRINDVVGGMEYLNFKNVDFIMNNCDFREAATRLHAGLLIGFAWLQSLIDSNVG